jgi:hypothetical protein
VTSSVPRVCPDCGGAVLPVVFGFPGPELFEAAERGEILLGGCCMEGDGPVRECNGCGRRWTDAVR